MRFSLKQIGGEAQIKAGSSFGKALTEAAARANVIVEIGTWKGMGSTFCLALGMTRLPQHLWTVEQDKERYQEAVSRWNRNPGIIFIHGRTLDVLDALPPAIDLLLLDGGEDCGWEDFQALAGRAQVIALDDTMTLKNSRVHAHLMASGWKVLRNEPDERNGWAIFERV